MTSTRRNTSKRESKATRLPIKQSLANQLPSQLIDGVEDWGDIRRRPIVPDEATVARARQDAAEGKAPSTQAGEFVREEIEHIREGKHGARSTKQAIAIGLSKARRAGIKLPAPKAGSTSARTRKQAKRDEVRGRTASSAAPSSTRSRATSRALKKEGHSAASHEALAKQAKSAARKRSRAARSQQAKRAARTRRANEASTGGSK
jgi:Family of unknown function (DUF6496)